jgi:hypothetical protein
MSATDSFPRNRQCAVLCRRNAPPASAGAAGFPLNRQPERWPSGMTPSRTEPSDSGRFFFKPGEPGEAFHREARAARCGRRAPLSCSGDPSLHDDFDPVRTLLMHRASPGSAARQPCRRGECGRLCWPAPEIGRGALDRREAPHLPSARSRPKTLCKFPLSDKNSLLSLQKFPARLCREFSCKPLNLRAEFASESLAGAEIGKNSRRFPEILGPKDRFG